MSAAAGNYKKNSFLIGFFVYSFDTTPCLVLKITSLKILRHPTHNICWVAPSKEGGKKILITIEDFKMAEAQEKDNTWVWVGFAIACIILLVVMLKKDETKHLQSGAVAASNAEIDAKLQKQHSLVGKNQVEK
jgi:hypothetical protein